MLNFRNYFVTTLLGTLTVATSALLVFIKLSEEVDEGDLNATDLGIMWQFRLPGQAAQPIGPNWLIDYARDITALGSTPVLGLLTLITVTFLLLIRQRFFALFVLLSTLGGTSLMVFLKDFFARPRPGFMAAGMAEHSGSFPSGHAMISAVVYLTLGALLTRLVPTLAVKVYIMSVAVLLTGLVGLSRIYLGVHWPSDVLAGWAAGAAWALAGMAVAQSVRLGIIAD